MTQLNAFQTQVNAPGDSVCFSRFTKTGFGGIRFEVKTDPLRIGKIGFNFQINQTIAGTAKMKQIGNIYLYMNKGTARVLAHKILHHELGRFDAAKGLFVPDQNGNWWRSLPAGTLADRLKPPHARGQGVAEFRQLSIKEGKKYPYMIRGFKSDGLVTPQGLITPSIGSDKKPKNASEAMIPLTADDLCEMALAIESAIHAYEASQMVLLAISQNSLQVSDANAEYDLETGEVIADGYAYVEEQYPANEYNQPEYPKDPGNAYIPQQGYSPRPYTTQQPAPVQQTSQYQSPSAAAQMNAGAAR